MLGVPHTVRERVSMWLSPWDNLVHGGDQLAHSLWAYATGGIAGTGIGQGDPQFVPAAHTDLILSVLGEQWGWLGVAAVFALYVFLVYRSFRIALRARSDYEFFLAAAIGAATALQILLIAGGSLGVLPLSGVVTPFLSYGRTAMIANFAMFGILLSVGQSQTAPQSHRSPSACPLTAAGTFFAIAAAIIVAKAAYIEILRSGPTIGAGTLVVQADGARRYQYNPRLQEIMREIPKGTIYDRNGLPLATSNWSELEQHRADYQALGIDIDRACPRTEARHYPFGGLMFDLLGDLRTRTRWGATNTSFVERDSARRLRGYDDRPTLVEVKNPSTGKMDRVLRYDYRELVPLLRHRREPNNPEVRRVLDRPRDVRMSIDARFEVKVAEILRNQLKQAGQTKGAAVVMDPATGDLLAAVSFPLARRGRRAGRGQSVPGSRALRSLSAGLHVQSGDRHGGAAQGRATGPQDVPVRAPARWPRRHFPQRLQAPHPRRRAGQDAARHARSGARPDRLLQRLLRAVGHLRCGRRRAARYGHAARHLRRIARHRGGVEEGAGAIGLRTGRGGGVAVPDGARGRHRRQ